MTIESTDEFADIEGVRCRIWNGKTPGGRGFFVFVALVAYPADEVDDDGLADELIECGVWTQDRRQ